MNDDFSPYQVSNAVANLNNARLMADLQRRTFSRFGRHNAHDYLDYERAVKKQMKDDSPLYEKLISDLHKLDMEFGNGIDPRWREPPEKITKLELERRYDLVFGYDCDSGRLKPPKVGGQALPEVHVYEEEDWERWLVPILRRRTDQKDMNDIHAFLGEVGSAKSQSAIQLECALDPRFDTTDIALSQELFFEIEGRKEESTKGRAVLDDDMSRWSNARRYGDEDNIITTEMFDTFRFKNKHHAITTPRDSRIDKGVREHIQLVFVSPGKGSQGVFQVGIPTWSDDGKMERVEFLRFMEPGTFIQDCTPFVWVLDSIRFKDPDTMPPDSRVRRIIKEYKEIKERLFWEADQKGRQLVELRNMQEKIKQKEIAERYATLPQRLEAQREALLLKQERNRLWRERLEKEQAQAELPDIEDRIEELAAEGLSRRDIVDKLVLEGYKTSLSAVQRHIKKLGVPIGTAD